MPRLKVPLKESNTALLERCLASKLYMHIIYGDIAIKSELLQLQSFHSMESLPFSIVWRPYTIHTNLLQQMHFLTSLKCATNFCNLVKYATLMPWNWYLFVHDNIQKTAYTRKTSLQYWKWVLTDGQTGSSHTSITGLSSTQLPPPPEGKTRKSTFFCFTTTVHTPTHHTLDLKVCIFFMINIWIRFGMLKAYIWLRIVEIGKVYIESQWNNGPFQTGRKSNFPPRIALHIGAERNMTENTSICFHTFQYYNQFTPLETLWLKIIR